MRKKEKIFRKWVVNWIPFNSFQGVQLGIEVTFNYFWLLLSLSFFLWIWHFVPGIWGLPWWFSNKESACQCRRCRRHRFDPWVRNIPWRRKWQSAPVFLPGKSHGQRSLAGYSPWGHKESDTAEHTLEPTHSQGPTRRQRQGITDVMNNCYC